MRGRHDAGVFRKVVLLLTGRRGGRIDDDVFFDECGSVKQRKSMLYVCCGQIQYSYHNGAVNTVSGERVEKGGGGVGPDFLCRV